jgi:hypothetical protein
MALIAGISHVNVRTDNLEVFTLLDLFPAARDIGRRVGICRWLVTQ